MRGTVSIGKFYLLKRNDRLLLIGPAVYDAAKSFENTDWIGISTSPSASLTLEQENKIEEVESLLNKVPISVGGLMKETYDMKETFRRIKSSFINCDIPTKNGVERNGWALSWLTFFDKGDLYHDQDEVKQILDEKLSYQRYQENSVSMDIYRKYKNTKDFFNFAISSREPIDMNSFLQRQ